MPMTRFDFLTTTRTLETTALSLRVDLLRVVPQELFFGMCRKRIPFLTAERTSHQTQKRSVVDTNPSQDVGFEQIDCIQLHRISRFCLVWLLGKCGEQRLRRMRFLYLKKISYIYIYMPHCSVLRTLHLGSFQRRPHSAACANHQIAMSLTG